ncbi:MAG TPA: imidazoleglycerol-phosphate dehydratase HisB [Candidatus Ventrimonas merdavium]|nr:imidazoleglycerol-phosphate dehydratase HisB [Candidatus Ventrimonas merdavium]
MTRTASITRNTKETKISLTLDLDGTGKAEVRTGIGFFDHMMEGFARHGLFDLTLTVEGDLHVDTHHTVEDTGIVLGQAIQEAVGDKAGLARYGHMILPMDDALMLCAVDLCGRPWLSWDVSLTHERVGSLETETVREFFYAVSYGAMMNLHVKQLSGLNDHHIIEGAFKAFARALCLATRKDERVTGVLSTKGVL